ncbi:TetR/AcrR family transcriptional regulator [Streptomyces sp. NPDC002588]|uniref:TetR/AcrR family transcriptional regulator n=1 Tax=Streptomyces sp. NPDC002588 TaxID=3154419 RepID=UPI00332C9180
MSARREEILEAALEVLADRGFKGTSIDAVAERAGLTRQGVLHYFPSKKRLLLEVLNLRNQVNRENLADRRLGEDWAGDFAETVAFEQHHPSFARVHSVVLAEAVTGQEPARGYVRERCRTLQDHLTEHIVQRYGDRVPSGLEARTAATALFAFIEGIHQLWLVDQDGDERYPEVVREVLSVLLGDAQVSTVKG